MIWHENLFPVYGAYSSLKYIAPSRWGHKQEAGLYYRDAVLVECLAEGEAILPDMHLEPGYLRSDSAAGSVEVTVSDCAAMLFRGKGMRLRFKYFEEQTGCGAIRGGMDSENGGFIL